MVYGVDILKYTESLASHINWYEHLVRHKGPLYAVKLLKRVRDVCLRYMADQSFERIDVLSLHEDGLPLKVGHLRELLNSKNINHRRACLHILDIVKLCEVEGDKPSVDSIISPPTGEVLEPNNEIGGTLAAFGKPKVDKETLDLIIRAYTSVLRGMFPPKKQGDRLKRLKTLSDIHMSVRKGPNGPALGTIEEDFLGVKQSGLLSPIESIASETQNWELQVMLRTLKSEIRDFENDLDQDGVKCIDSRLAIKYEPWGKTRYFAICDWYSQSALKGIHKWIFSWLARQTEDGTMSQDRVANIVKEWTAVEPTLMSQRVYSLDLSKATDRLPATLQREVLTQMFGKDVADKWYTICTNRKFRTPDLGDVAFKVGQPLGVYSSWAMLALTHHVICRTALKLSGIKSNSKSPKYVVIGDDVAMVGPKVAKWYSLIMSGILQVDVSPIKGFTPETSLGINPFKHLIASHAAEIAKRVFIDGEELTVVSPETLKSAWEYPADFPNLIRQMTNRGMSSETMNPVAPLALAGLGFKPDLACILATFPLRTSVSPETVGYVNGNYPGLLDFVPWFQSEIPISVNELETMFRWTVRSRLQGTLNKFKEKIQVYLDLSCRPKRRGQRMYHIKSKEYIIRVLINKALLNILCLVMQSDALNFQGPGMLLDEIASGLNLITDFDSALTGKPVVQRENLYRLRSRVITNLQPLVLKTIRKAKENWGILLIDAGEQTTFVPEQLADIHQLNLLARELLTHEEDKSSHDLAFSQTVDLAERRTMEILG